MQKIRVRERREKIIEGKRGVGEGKRGIKVKEKDEI